MLLGVAAALAGFIDAIAGGGGLISIPALLAAGVPPVSALATNKLQSMFSVATACARFARTGLIDFRRYGATAALVFLCAALGGIAIQFVPTRVLTYVMPVLILLVVGYVLFSPRMSDIDSHERLGRGGYAPIAGAIGFYDGLFGPGAGSFYATSLVALRGMGLKRAVANTKLFNFMSNVAAFIMFAIGGHMLWAAGLLMAVCGIAGAWIGSHFAIRFGARLIRPLLVVMSLGLTAKMVAENWPI